MRVYLMFLRWLVVRAGYVVRPYDMLADRRRWFWQPRTTCRQMAAQMARRSEGGRR